MENCGVFHLCADPVEMNQGSHYDAFAVNADGALEQLEETQFNNAYTLDGSALRWDTGEHDVYYQGESSLTPPVTAEIRYELNGQPITAEELLGKSGHVRITVPY